jgi:hypothetical protein
LVGVQKYRHDAQAHIGVIITATHPVAAPVSRRSGGKICIEGPTGD